MNFAHAVHRAAEEGFTLEDVARELRKASTAYLRRSLKEADARLLALPAECPPTKEAMELSTLIKKIEEALAWGELPLYPGIRADVAGALGVQCTGHFHELFNMAFKQAEGARK